ncbi:hypothetical protein [Clostridium lentum]|uniref:Uncharacterized protein n=1 Tax=Clostridium lentum TaxID=2763037 RepID=A0A8I0A411_9CLOT|nr:hypothetical protein [Clostridium lentum]MBC5638999.1 hypothetical protein [Clostridium lentum]
MLSVVKLLSGDFEFIRVVDLDCSNGKVYFEEVRVISNNDRILCELDEKIYK